MQTLCFRLLDHTGVYIFNDTFFKFFGTSATYQASLVGRAMVPILAGT